MEEGKFALDLEADQTALLKQLCVVQSGEVGWELCWVPVLPRKGPMSHSSMGGLACGVTASTRGRSRREVTTARCSCAPACAWLVSAVGWGIISLQRMLIRGLCVREKPREVKLPITTVNNEIRRVIITRA